jgi:hypothetical protein
MAVSDLIDSLRKGHGIGDASAYVEVVMFPRLLMLLVLTGSLFSLC